MAPADPSRDLAPGQIVGGKWRVVRLIGRGGMGAVYEGQNTGIGKRVALKFIDPEFASYPEIV
ncbi:MAG TPA: serine/threonine protein kinase, partial [Polyangiaceae bacterium]